MRERMRSTGALVLLPLVAVLLLVPLAAADPALPADLQVVQNDDYNVEVPVGQNASFAWSLVNTNATATYRVNVSGTVDVSDYVLTVRPTRIVLDPGRLATIFANVTVPLSPSVPQATVSVLLEVEGGNFTVLQATVNARSGLQLIDLITAFLAVGAIIFIGFVASLVFERTKVPDLIFLIILGVILGPVLATFFGVSLIPLSLLKLATPYFAALALMIILFDGGLNLNIRQVVSRAGVSLLHTGITFSGSVFVVTIISMWLLGYPLWVGVLLGAIVGGTSGAVVITVVRGMTLTEDSRTILVLESTITDVLCIIGALTVIGVLRGGGSLSGTLGGLLTAFTVALVLGFVTGILWLRVLGGMQGKPFGFMITIAALFILYAGTEFLGGSGGMAALIFGLVLGNHKEVGRALRIREAFRMDGQFKQFHSEISFVVRTFFFVFLGFSFTLPFAASWNIQTEVPVFSLLNNTFWLILAAIALFIIGIYAVRATAAFLTTRIHAECRPDRRAITAMMGRGLAAAVLASLPFAIPPFTDPRNPDYLLYHSTMAPYETQFLTIAFLVIILTVIATTVGVVSSERSRQPTGEFGKAATELLGEAMQEQTRETQRELERKQKQDRQRREKELRRIEKELRRKRKS